MAREISESELKKSSRLQYIDTDQLEYTAKNTLLYGSLVAGLITLGVTYIYLLVQKIKN